MTEDTMRQLLMAQLAPAPGASPTEVHGAIDAILRTLRQARDGEGPESELFEAIQRSLAEAPRQQAPPAAVEVVKNLPRKTWKANAGRGPHEPDECPICLAPHEEGDEMSVLPCKHELHTECLMPWLKQTNSCPLCRHQLATDSKDYDQRRRQQEEEQAAALEREGRPDHIRTDGSASPAAGRTSVRRPVLSGEFGVPAQGGSGTSRSGGDNVQHGTVGGGDQTTGSSHLSSDSSASGTPSRDSRGLRRGFLQDLGAGGFGEGRSTVVTEGIAAGHAGMRRGFLQERGSRRVGQGPSPQQSVGGSIAGVTGIRHVPREEISPQQAQSGNRILRMQGAVASHGSETTHPWHATQGHSPEGNAGSDGARVELGGGVDPRNWSVRKLKGVLRSARVRHDDCLEKDDLVRRCLDNSDLIASASRDYDARLAAGGEQADTTRLPRTSMPTDAAAGSGQAPRPWSPTAQAAASLFSCDWLSGGMRQSDVDEFSPSRAAAGEFFRSPSLGGVPLDSLAGRTPVQERNTASHAYARLPRRSNSDRSRNLYNRPTTNRTEPFTSGVATTARRRGTEDKSQPQASGAVAASESTSAFSTAVHASQTRRVRLGPPAGSGEGRSNSLAGDRVAAQCDRASAGHSLPNAVDNERLQRDTSADVTSGALQPQSTVREDRSATASGPRPGSSAGLRPRASSSAFVGVLGDEGEVMPAEDPYVRLLREREREWRGRTLQMMTGGDEDEDDGFVDRYVRLGR